MQPVGNGDRNPATQGPHSGTRPIHSSARHTASTATGNRGHRGHMNQPANTLAPVDPAAYRDVLGHYPTGVDGRDRPSTATSRSAWWSAPSRRSPSTRRWWRSCPPRGSGTYARLATRRVLLHQRARARPAGLCRTMAVPGDDKFAKVAWQRSDTAPRRSTTPSRRSTARRSTQIEAGDHYIVLCRVQALEVNRPVTPLLFFQGGYGGFSPAGMAAKRRRGPDRGHPAGRHRRDRGRAAGPAAPVRGRRAGRRRPRRAHHRLQRLRRIRGDGRAPGPAHPAHPADRRGLRRRRGPRGRRALAGQGPPAGRGAASGSTAPASPPSRADGVGAVRAGRRQQRSTNALGEALREYGEGEVTPAREREFRQLLAQNKCFFEDVELVADRTYTVGGIVVPRCATPRATSRWSCASPSCRRRGHRRGGRAWIAAVKQAAARGRAMTSPGRPARHALQDYRDWYAADFPM